MEFNIVCECGMNVKGTSEIHANANLKLHKRGWRHKEIMENKKLNAVTKR